MFCGPQGQSAIDFINSASVCCRRWHKREEEGRQGHLEGRGLGHLQGRQDAHGAAVRPGEPSLPATRPATFACLCSCLNTSHNWLRRLILRSCFRCKGPSCMSDSMYGPFWTASRTGRPVSPEPGSQDSLLPVRLMFPRHAEPHRVGHRVQLQQKRVRGAGAPDAVA